MVLGWLPRETNDQPTCCMGDLMVQNLSLNRRRVQQSVCGFHGPPHRPYKDVGTVQLDDRKLILEGLGQDGSEEQVRFPLLHVCS